MRGKSNDTLRRSDNYLIQGDSHTNNYFDSHLIQEEVDDYPLEGKGHSHLIQEKVDGHPLERKVDDYLIEG